MTLRQRYPSVRFDVFIPDKAAMSSPEFRFQDPTKAQSNKVLNAIQTLWKSITINLPTNVSSQ